MRWAENQRFYQSCRELLSAAQSKSKSPQQRRFLEYDSRILESAASGINPASMVDLKQGVDEFSAYLIAKAYVHRYIGLCVSIGDPLIDEYAWNVRVDIGRGGYKSTILRINRVSGSITCDGYESVQNPIALLSIDKKIAQ